MIYNTFFCFYKYVRCSSKQKTLRLRRSVNVLTLVFEPLATPIWGNTYYIILR